MKEFIKKFIPKRALALYHLMLAYIARIVYGNPSKKLIVIGVTGTNGKTTVANLISAILEEAGHKTGVISTVNFKVAAKERLNDLKMTMPGRFRLQRMLRQMVRAGCEYAVIETSSEGIRQYRHLGVNYDVGVFTNLAPEHLASHGGFENYKKAKLKLFAHIQNSNRKKLTTPSLSPPSHGGEMTVPKIIIVNADDRHAGEFLGFGADKKLTFSIEKESDYQASGIEINKDGSMFRVMSYELRVKSPGRFNIYNSLAAIAAANSLGVGFDTIKSALEKFAGVPGRMEQINEGQPFAVIVDYAPEPVGLHETYQALNFFEKKKIIHILGSTGGGRDKSRRPILGYIAGMNADLVIITNEDPYDEDPRAIIDQVAAGAVAAGKRYNRDLFKILDRREAIRFALSKAASGDLVLITGKGSEQAMVVARGRKVKWDDRVVVREELQNLRSTKLRTP